MTLFNNVKLFKIKKVKKSTYEVTHNFLQIFICVNNFVAFYSLLQNLKAVQIYLMYIILIKYVCGEKDVGKQ